jgi:hypothetical protein
MDRLLGDVDTEDEDVFKDLLSLILFGGEIMSSFLAG